jgi:hypothetical protein
LSKKKNKQWHGGSLVATAERKGKKTSIKGTPNHFEKMLEGSCPNHAFLVKHLYMDCSLMKRFLSGGSKKGDVSVRSRGGPKPMGECCVSLTWMVMQGEHTGVYPGSGKRRPYIQRGRKSFVFPCTGVLA